MKLRLTKRDKELKLKIRKKLIKKGDKLDYKSSKTIVRSLRFTNDELMAINKELKRTKRNFTNYMKWRLFE